MHPWSRDEIAAHDASLKQLARKLVSTEEEAEDVVQEAWLAALESPPSRFRNAVAWLRSVTRYCAYHMRQQKAQRRNRERLAARSLQVPASQGQFERPLAKRSLERAIDGLREPYRTVLRLRFFEELSTPEISRRLDRPLGTVKSQLRRGLEQVRTKTPHGRRDVGGWLSVLGFLSSPLRRPGHALLASVPFMFVGWLWFGLTDAPRAGRLAAVASAPDRARHPAEASFKEDARTLGRVLSSPAAPTTTGSGDQQRAASSVQAGDGELLHVYGVVTDGPAPLAGVPIYVSAPDRPHEEFLRARTDVAGRYELRVDRRSWIGTRPIGGSPSVLFSMAPSESKRESLQLDFPLCLDSHRIVRGRVFGPDGLPAADARVEVGVRQYAEPTVAANGLWALRPPPARTRTDAEGRFQAPVFGSRRNQVVVTATGCAPWRGATPRDSDASMSIDLVRPAALSVFARHEDGLPALDAEVVVEQEALGPQRATITTEGVALLSGLAPGHATIRVLDGTNRRGTAFIGSCSLRPGETAMVRVTLSERWTIAGLALDELGNPLRGKIVEARSPGWAVRRTTTEQDGSFLFGPHEAAAHTVLLYEADGANVAPSVWKRNVRTGERALRLTPTRETQPSATLLGELILPADLEYEGIDVVATPQEGTSVGDWSLTALVDPATGHFQWPLLPPLSYEVSLQLPRLGRWPVGTVDLRAGEEYDLGRVILPNFGSIELCVVTDDTFRPSERSVFAFPTNGSGRIASTSTTWDGPTQSLVVRFDRLLPGEHQVRFFDRGRIHGSERVVVESARHTSYPVTFRPRTPAEITVHLMTALPSRSRVHIEVTARHTGDTVFAWRRDPFLTSTPMEFIPLLPPGRYDVRAWTDCGRSAHAPLTIDSTPSPHPIQLRL